MERGARLGVPLSSSTVHSISVFAFKNKTNTHFVDLSSVDGLSYLAKYDGFVVSSPRKFVDNRCI